MNNFYSYSRFFISLKLCERYQHNFCFFISYGLCLISTLNSLALPVFFEFSEGQAQEYLLLLIEIE